MPGMIEHLYFCQVVCDALSARQTRVYKDLEKEMFMMGGILPDMAKEHRFSHFKVGVKKVWGLYAPDLYSAGRSMFMIRNWSLRMGVYAHLYLDRYFVKKFLVPRFQWDMKKQGKITNLATGEVFETEQFFSSEGLYRAYGEVNSVILSKGLLDLEWVKSLPDELPSTGLAVFDEKIETSWKEQLEMNIKCVCEQTDRVLPVDDYLAFSNETARRLMAEIIYAW